MTQRPLLMATALVALALLGPLLAGCGGGGDDDPPPLPESRWPAHCTTVPGACK